MKTISVSQIGTFTTCQYKWHVQYQRGIRVRSHGIAPTVLGDVTHKALAAGLVRYAELGDYATYNDLFEAINTSVEKWDNDNRPEDRQVVDIDGDNIISYETDDDFYIRWEELLVKGAMLAQRTLVHMNLLQDYEVMWYQEEPLVEFRIEYEIPGTDYGFVGIVDAVLFNRKTGIIEILDWKVRHKFTEMENEHIDMQVGIYQYALYALTGVHAHIGTIYQIRDEVPNVPTLNKDLSMSRRKIASDWPTYREALLLAGLEPDDYIDEMMPKLADTEFWRPLSVVRTLPVLEKLWDNLLEYVSQLTHTTRFPRAYGYSCRSCAFLDLCNAELYNYDTDELFETRYQYTDWSTENAKISSSDGD